MKLRLSELAQQQSEEISAWWNEHRQAAPLLFRQELREAMLQIEAKPEIGTPLTPLERELIDRTAQDHWPGFQADRLKVIRRENTGAGRYVYLKDGREQELRDGIYSAEGQMIEMDGVRNGLGFAIDVSASRINYLEMFTFGNEDWDGVERLWKMV